MKKNVLVLGTNVEGKKDESNGTFHIKMEFQEHSPKPDRNQENSSSTW